MMLKTLHRRFRFIGAAVSILMVRNVEAAQTSKIVLTGSSTLAPLVYEIAKRFEKSNPGVRIDVQSGGSTRGINDARSGIADIGMVSRSLNPAESDLISHTIALDSLAVIVHKSNPVPTLTNTQIQDIFTGKISNWKDVGSADLKITVINKAEGRATLEQFLSFFQLRSRDVKAHVVVGENQQGIKTVSGGKGAIGYVSIGAAEFEASQGTAIRLLPLDGVASTVTNVRTGKMSISRPLILVTKSRPTALVERFIQYSQSSEVHDLIHAQFFIPPKR